MNAGSHPDPLTRFEEEHQHALGQLERLESAAAGLEAGLDPAPHLAVMGEVHAFLSTAVRQHNENEEFALFPLLAEEAPTGVFEEEHKTLRRLETELSAALRGPAAATAAPRVAHALVELLRDHIEREDTVLFPMARGILGTEGLARVEELMTGR